MEKSKVSILVYNAYHFKPKLLAFDLLPNERYI